MRGLKIVGIAVAGLIGLAMLAAVAVWLLVDPNAYRGDIERLAEQHTGRPLHIGGKLDLKLFPWLAISIADVRLGNPPGYGSVPFVTVRQASVGVRLLPILRKRLEVSRLSVDGLTANLVSRSVSDNNWKDLTAPKGASQSAGGGAPQASIAGVDISNASLIYRDEAKKSVTTLSNLHLHTGAVGGNDPVDATLEFDYGNGGSKPVAHIVIATRAQLPSDSPQVALRDLDVHGTWFGSSPSATPPLNFSVRSPSVVLDTQAQSLAPAALTAQAGSVNVQLTATGEKLFADRIVTGKLTMPRLAARTALTSFGVALPATRDPRALSALALSSDYRLTAKQLQLTNLELTLDDTRVRGAAAVEDLDTMALGYDLNVDRIDLDRYLPPKPAPRSGQAAPNAQAARGAQTPPTPTSLPIETLRTLDVRGTLQVGQATFSGLTFTGVSLPLAAKSGRVHLGPTRAGLLSGTYNGDIMLDASRGGSVPAQVSMNEHMKGVDVGALMKAVLDTTRLSGHGDVNAVVSGVGNTDQAILRSLGGKIDFNVKQGALNGVDLSYELQRAQTLLQKQLPPTRSGPERTLFNTFSGSANLDRGVMRNDDLSIETDLLRAHGQGTLDLGTKGIDYRLVVSLYKLGDKKAADVPLLLSGNLENLKIRPDLEALAAAKVRQEVNDRLQGKKDELRKKLGDKLRDLLSR
jgi:AsmA protein